MNSNEITYGLIAFLLFFGITSALIIAVLVFFTLGSRSRPRFDDAAKAVLGLLQTSQLTLVAVLLAFGVSMAAVRFETRRVNLAEEGVAIGTSLLRTDLLGNADRQRLRRLLLQHIDARLRFYADGAAEHYLSHVRPLGLRVEQDLWSAAVSAVKKDRSFTSAPLLLQSLNETFDIREKQELAYTNHLPKSITALLLIASVITFAGLGFISGVNNQRLGVFSLLLGLLFALTLFVIVDLDRPRGGLIRVRPVNLERLKQDVMRTLPF